MQRYGADERRAAAEHRPAHGRYGALTRRGLGYPGCRKALADRTDGLTSGERRAAQPRALAVTQRREAVEALETRRAGLEAEMRRLELKRDVVHGAIGLPGKGAGAAPENGLTSKGETLPVDGLRPKRRLSEPLEALSTPRPSHRYQAKAVASGDPGAGVRKAVRAAFAAGGGMYGGGAWATSWGPSATPSAGGGSRASCAGRRRRPAGRQGGSVATARVRVGSRSAPATVRGTTSRRRCRASCGPPTPPGPRCRRASSASAPCPTAPTGVGLMDGLEAPRCRDGRLHAQGCARGHWWGGAGASRHPPGPRLPSQVAGADIHLRGGRA